MSGLMQFQAAYSELFFVQELTEVESIAEEFKGRSRSGI
jgi:undecaprenyl pyrophosphate synthase